jgi:hypothetical protein
MDQLMDTNKTDIIEQVMENHLLIFKESFLQFHPNQIIISRHKQFRIIGIKSAIGSCLAGKNSSKVFVFGSENQHSARAGGKYPKIMNPILIRK